MFSRAVKFLDIVSNELSYAAQVLKQREELEQANEALSRTIEERDEYKERWESREAYTNYLLGAYMEASNYGTELEAQNERLCQQIKALKSENGILKKSSETAAFILSKVLGFIGENKKLLSAGQALFSRVYDLHKEVETLKAENEKQKDWGVAYKSLLKDYYEVFDRQREIKRTFTVTIKRES